MIQCTARSRPSPMPAACGNGRRAPFHSTSTRKWAGAKSAVTPGMQMNLVSTNDIIGGNSGSPLLDRQGRIVGLVFDGNIHSLGGAFGFDPALNRAVSVSSQILIEGLRKVYGANRSPTSCSTSRSPEQGRRGRCSIILSGAGIMPARSSAWS